MKQKGFLSLLLVLVVFFSAAAEKYPYETVDNDPLKAKIYTLPNGLKIFMTVNKSQPRIQTYIPVRVGGKNDPSETTGLAHYFEHMMFKGTPNFGTIDYEAEKPLLDEIENLFEIYRHTTDSTARAALYHKIDSVSYEASKYAVPNEYDKLMASIGANGTNAYTSYDVTCYVEDIPSNQIDKWAKIQADRFEHPVLRGFHTELETIYEEKNMSLTQDIRKMYDRMFALLFPTHPYGTQTILGTQTHLKNPSITNIKKYHEQWYVPNNMAICVSGDFDPDEMVDIISKYFGHLKPNPSLPVLEFKEPEPIHKPVIADVYGNDAERMMIAWRLPEAASPEMAVIDLLVNVLHNGTAGLIDLDLNQSQKIQGGSAFSYELADRSAFIAGGSPKSGQSLDEVRELLLDEVKKLRSGDFSDALLEAVKSNYKLDIQKSLTDNDNRANYFVDAFVDGINWSDYVNQRLNSIDGISKEQIVAAANRYLGDNNYVVINKRQGKPTDEIKVAKPAITPIVMNRDTASTFLTEIIGTPVTPIEPVFVDYSRDLTVLSAKGDIPVLYNQNKDNDIFTLTFVFETGSNNDRLLGMASGLLDLTGTDDMTPADIRNAFYQLACDYRISIGGERSYITLTGLSENMPAALDLLEKFIAEAKPDDQAYGNLVNRTLKSRENAKANQSQNFSRLSSYVMYGPEGPVKNILSEQEMRELNAARLLESLRGLTSLRHRIIYYGPETPDRLLSDLGKHHRVPSKLKEPPTRKSYPYVTPEETVIFIAPYDAKQLYMGQFANHGKTFDHTSQPLVELYNEYFGGSMNAIVFQEMRERRSLAYSAWAFLNAPYRLDRPYVYRTQIATQNDKLMDAVSAFNEIIEEMPLSEAAFALAKESIDSRMRTERTINDDIAWSYINAQDLGLDHPIEKDVFHALQSISLDDLLRFQQQNIKGRHYYYGILGDIEDLDLDALSKIGRIVILTPEDIFGY